MTGAPTTYAVVTGGGTSGHVLPALAIADALVARGHAQQSIRYVGTTRGVESRLVPPAGYPCTLLDVVGLQRSLSTRNLWFLPKLLRSTWQALGLLKQWRPRVVVNVGGYGSVPATLAARLRRVPVVIVSYDRRPGLVSKLFARGAAACAVAFEGSALPHAELTGAPVRREIVRIERGDEARAQALTALDLPVQRFVVAVVCGSLGAKAVNDVVAGAVERLATRRDLSVYHIVGDRFVADAAPARDGDDGILYRVIGYEERMPLVYTGADLMLTRGGAGTIAELASAGVPAIIVPWPGAAENHQVDNAKVLSERGAALLIEQPQLSVDRLVAEIDRLASSPPELAAMASAAHDAGTMHRSTALVDVIERVAAG